MQQLPPQLDDLRYHHHPQYTSSAPYHQPTAATGESRIGCKMFSSANKHAIVHCRRVGSCRKGSILGFCAAALLLAIQWVVRRWNVLLWGGCCTNSFSCLVSRVPVSVANFTYLWVTPTSTVTYTRKDQIKFRECLLLPFCQEYCFFFFFSIWKYKF